MYIITTGHLEIYHLVGGSCRQPPNDPGHYLTESLGIELGICQGSYKNQTLSWLPW
ncbi:hypothetical protein [Trichodesmium erythraeum]|uniref:hypothetical protein n=1 Tax=Trichodesmium erythraeum TaxID=1206 RepID=UPI0000392BD0